MTLSLRQRVQAARFARKCKGKTEAETREYLESQGTRLGFDPTIIILFLQIGLAIWKYMQSKDVSSMSDAELVSAVSLSEE